MENIQSIIIIPITIKHGVSGMSFRKFLVAFLISFSLLFFSTNAFSESGDNFLYKFYSKVKEVPYKDSYAKFSGKLKNTLPFSEFIYWWDKTVDSVYVEAITQVGDDLYEVKLFYIMKAYKKQQCSDDILRLINKNGRWLIDSIHMGKC